MINDMFDDVFRYFDALTNYTEDSIVNRGLKTVIKKPHNLYSVHDADGNIIKQVLEVVYTPFSKNDIDVTTEDDYLVIKIGRNNEPNAISSDNISMIYHGISGQCAVFKLRLTDSVDAKSISAKAEDGILRIDIPIIKKKEQEPLRIKIQ